MARDTVIGKAETDFTWLDYNGEWTTNLFRAGKFDGNTAVILSERLKKMGEKCHTEPLATAMRRQAGRHS